MKPGYRFIWIAPGRIEDGTPIMEAFVVGFRQIAKQYPDHVLYEEM
jgi:hypothetical protein